MWAGPSSPSSLGWALHMAKSLKLGTLSCLDTVLKHLAPSS